MKKRRLMAALLALLLVSAMPLRALADEWYLEDGDIHIEATSTDGGQTQTQTVTQGETTKNDAAPVVTQRDSSTATSNNVTIESSGGATAVVTVENVNIDTGSDTSGGDTSPIDVVNGSQAIITVSGENHVNVGHDVSGVSDKAAAVHVGNSTVVIQGDPSDGADTLNVTKDNTDGAAIGSDHNEAFSGELTIRDVTVTATDGNIGSGMAGDFSGTLVIDGSDVTAKGNHNESGIGGGYGGDYSGTVIITGGSAVEATGRDGAGIGGGLYGDYSGTVIVTGSSTVTAEGEWDAAGIGGGFHGDYSGTVIVAGGSKVIAESERGAGIGCDDMGDYSGTVIQETGSAINAAGGNGGIGLGASDPELSRNAEVKENVDLTGYPTAPADPKPLPWSESMFPKDPDPTPEPTATPEPPSAITPVPEPDEAEPETVDNFWKDQAYRIRKAAKGDTITIEATYRTTIPAWIIELAAEKEVTLCIHWNGGNDITIPADGSEKLADKPYHSFTDLAEIFP